jgi:hypothetical protein
MMSHLATQYDMRNIFDLARYLLPTPTVPMRWRRRMIALGSGEPTRAICSTLIAEAFDRVRYPIPPRVERLAIEKSQIITFWRHEILHIRHHMPRPISISCLISRSSNRRLKKASTTKVSPGDRKRPDICARARRRWDTFLERVLVPISGDVFRGRISGARLQTHFGTHLGPRPQRA